MRPKISSISTSEKEILKEEAILVFDFLKNNLEALSKGEIVVESLESLDFDNPLDNDPERSLQAIHNLISGIQSKKIELDVDHSDLALCIGHTTALLAKEYLKWDLSFLACDYWPKGEIAVVAKDKKRVIYPAIYVYMVLEGEENNLFPQLFKFKSGDLPETKSKFSVIL